MFPHNIPSPYKAIKAKIDNIHFDAFIVLNLFLKSPSIIQHNANNPMTKFVIAIEVGIVIPNKINKTCCILFTTLFIT